MLVPAYRFSRIPNIIYLGLTPFIEIADIPIFASQLIEPFPNIITFNDCKASVIRNTHVKILKRIYGHRELGQDKYKVYVSE